jgi:hypothetical protein
MSKLTPNGNNLSGRSRSKRSIQDEQNLLKQIHDSLDDIVVEPPDHFSLNSGELLFFYDIIEEYPNAEWSSHQLTIACMMAREIYAVEREQRRLRKEEMVAPNVKGWPCSNPRRNVINGYINSIMKLRQSLALHIRANTSGKGAARRLQQEKDSQSEMNYLYGDQENSDLIPMQ